MTVALTQGLPEARGHTWTPEDYARRDASLAALGLSVDLLRGHTQDASEATS